VRAAYAEAKDRYDSAKLVAARAKAQEPPAPPTSERRAALCVERARLVRRLQELDLELRAIRAQKKTRPAAPPERRAYNAALEALRVAKATKAAVETKAARLSLQLNQVLHRQSPLAEPLELWEPIGSTSAQEGPIGSAAEPEGHLEESRIGSTNQSEGEVVGVEELVDMDARDWAKIAATPPAPVADLHAEDGDGGAGTEAAWLAENAAQEHAGEGPGR
jgi:hypothetical protein